MIDPIGGPTPIGPSGAAPAETTLSQEREAALREAAQNLEASFISEMLKQAKFGEARGAFGGGAGEEQFASFLRTEHAEAIARQGGFGLAESIFNALVARIDGES